MLNVVEVPYIDTGSGLAIMEGEDPIDAPLIWFDEDVKNRKELAALLVSFMEYNGGDTSAMSSAICNYIVEAQKGE